MSNAAIAEFVEVTGATAEAAQFYLDSAGGDVSAAVDQYFASGGELPAADAPAPTQHAPPPAPARADPGSQPASAAGRAAASRAGGIRSLADLGQDQDSDSDDGGNEYYAGGEKSGQVVRGAPKNKEAAGERISGLFAKAREAGAMDGTSADLQTGKGQPSSFSGTAHSLTGQPGAQPAAPQGPTPIVHVITFYNNGIFVVDDGEPRDIQDPANLPFMSSIQRGECPAELEPAEPTQPIKVNLMRKDEDYKPPEKPRYVAFSGAGYSLAGSSGAGPSSSTAPASNAAGAPSSGVKWEGVNEAEPTTSIQLRLQDGSRLVARFNLSHTVADIRRFLAASRPDMRPGYALVTAFPAAQLTDDSQTIQAAGLSNAVIIQK